MKASEKENVSDGQLLMCDKPSKDECSDAKDVMTSAITLKVSSLLSNPAILQSAITQIMNNTSDIQKENAVQSGNESSKSDDIGQDVAASDYDLDMSIVR